MPTYILGLHTGHNATAALMRDGAIVGCVSEERFTGVKNDSGIPRRSVAWLLADAGIQGKDLMEVAVATRWRSGVFDPVAASRQLHLRTLRRIHDGIGVLRWYGERACPPLRSVGRCVDRVGLRAFGAARARKERTELVALLGVRAECIRTYDHHSCHAAAAYHGSPHHHADAVVFTIDAEGDGLSASVSVVRGGQWERIDVTSSDASLGWIYREVTGYLGMRRDEHEYKVMGLAPYAKEQSVRSLYERMRHLITLDRRHRLRFQSRFTTHLMRWYLRKEMRERRFDDIAGACQKLVEDRLCEWVQEGVRRTEIRTVCLGGGVTMNVKANLCIAELPEVERLWPCPSAGDESTVIGACYLAYETARSYGHSRPLARPLRDLYLGPSCSNEEVLRFLEEGGYFQRYHIEYRSDIECAIAELLVQGEVVARMAGRMEWGARALGNRSILANPSDRSIVRVINEQMKQRDFWMPFTPTILRERMSDYLVNPKQLPAPYMTLAFRSTPLAKEHLCAAMHPADGTIRPQLLDEAWNPSYYRVIKEFERRTGIGGVLNTSFNLHGYPIVLGPTEAMGAFERSGLACLVLENYLVQKRRVHP